MCSRINSIHLTQRRILNDLYRWTLGRQYLKLSTVRYPFLQEVEDLTMHLASIAKINLVAHSLIKLELEELAYVS